MSETTGPSRGTLVFSMGVAVVCMVTLVVTAWAASQYRRASVRGPVLVNPVSLAVAPDGTLYCATELGRVHKYAWDGRGQGAFEIRHVDVPIRIQATDEGHLAVGYDGRTTVLIYDGGGRIIETRTEPDAFARFAPSAGDWLGSRDGARVSLRQGAIVEQRDGIERVLVPAPPFPLTLYANSPWLLVIGLFVSAMGICAAFVVPFLARPESEAVS